MKFREELHLGDAGHRYERDRHSCSFGDVSLVTCQAQRLDIDISSFVEERIPQRVAVELNRAK